MPPTIKEIARQAGVAISTVSSVLNRRDGKAKASDETRDRILRIARELHYSPSPMARGLRTGRSYLVALLRENISDDIVGKAISGAEDVFHKFNYNLALCTFSNPADCETRVDGLLRAQLDGALVACSDPDYAKIFGKLAQHVPVVNLFSRSAFGSRCGVFVAPESIGRLGAEYLLRLGHRGIALLGCRPHSDEAFFATLAASGIKREECLHLSEFREFHESEYTLDLILRQKHKITAVFAYSDKNAAGIIQAATRRGIAVPRELSVLGINNDPFGEMLVPPLSTVAQPQYEQGEKAADALLKLINGGNVSDDIVLQPSLLERGSCTVPSVITVNEK